MSAIWRSAYHGSVLSVGFRVSVEKLSAKVAAPKLLEGFRVPTERFCVLRTFVASRLLTGGAGTPCTISERYCSLSRLTSRSRELVAAEGTIFFLSAVETSITEAKTGTK